MREAITDWKSFSGHFAVQLRIEGERYLAQTAFRVRPQDAKALARAGGRRAGDRFHRILGFHGAADLVAVRHGGHAGRQRLVVECQQFLAHGLHGAEGRDALGRIAVVQNQMLTNEGIQQAAAVRV